MAQRLPSHSRRESSTSDSVVERSGEPERKPREKYADEPIQPPKKPRMRAGDGSEESDSVGAISSSARSFQKQPNLGMKIRNKWKEFKAKFSGESITATPIKKPATESTYMIRPDLSKAEKIKVWRDNGQRLLDNKAVLQRDFADSANEVTTLLDEGDDENAAQQFDETS